MPLCLLWSVCLTIFETDCVKEHLISLAVNYNYAEARAMHKSAFHVMKHDALKFDYQTGLSSVKLFNNTSASSHSDVVHRLSVLYVTICDVAAEYNQYISYKGMCHPNGLFLYDMSLDIGACSRKTSRHRSVFPKCSKLWVFAIPIPKIFRCSQSVKNCTIFQEISLKMGTFLAKIILRDGYGF